LAKKTTTGSGGLEFLDAQTPTYPPTLPVFIVVGLKIALLNPDIVHKTMQQL